MTFKKPLKMKLNKEQIYYNKSFPMYYNIGYKLEETIRRRKIGNLDRYIVDFRSYEELKWEIASAIRGSRFILV